jgi:pyruvate,water dikinase
VGNAQPCGTAALGQTVEHTADDNQGEHMAGNGITFDRWVCDVDPSPRFPLYTRANVGEVFPDPVFPFTRSIALFVGAELGWRDAWVRMGAFELEEFRPDIMDVIGVFGGYCYLNASIIRLFGERAPGLSAQAMDEQFFGAQPGIPPYEEQPGDVRPDLSENVGAWMGYVLTTQSLPELLDDQAVTKELRAERPDVSALSDQELVERAVGLYRTHFRHLFAQHLHATYAASVPVGILAGVTAAIGRPDLLTALISGVGDVDSAAPSLAMWTLSRSIRESPELMAAFDAGVGGLADRLADSTSADVVAFRAAFDGFLYEFGSRGPNEWDTARPTWETRPALALSAIDRMRLVDDSADPTQHQLVLAAGREAAVAEARAILEAAGVDDAIKQQFELGYACGAVWLPARERTKTNCIRFTQEARIPMRELGRRMVEQGHFEAVEDFSFLFVEEFPAFFADPGSFKAIIAERKAQWDQLAACEPQFVFDKVPDFPSGWVRRDSVVYEVLTAGESLQGIPGCVGVAEGIARVVLDSNDPTALGPGDVLIAPATDPSWTPLFVPAAAVVVDVGAAMSHAVIVSRELGIPCVISATGATRRITDGTRVRVDGNTGVVTVL